MPTVIVRVRIYVRYKTRHLFICCGEFVNLILIVGLWYYINPASSKPVKLPGVNGCFQGMYIFPLLELLNVALHPNPVVSIGFQEEIIIDGKREEDVVLQIARRDMPKGDRCKVRQITRTCNLNLLSFLYWKVRDSFSRIAYFIAL